MALAAEVLCTRWTAVLLRELVAGSTRFNDLRRGVPRMSPALLVKRLRDLEKAGIVRRVAAGRSPAVVAVARPTCAAVLGKVLPRACRPAGQGDGARQQPRRV